MDEIGPGARGRAVADVQTRLAALGYSVGPSGADGVFAAATEQAVRGFQESRGLPGTGTVDGPTWRALVDATLTLGDRVLYLRRPHLHGEDVRQLQQALATLGFRCSIDGVFGVNSEHAVREFQRNVGLVADGMVGRATTAALTRLAPALADRRPAPGPRLRDAVFGPSLAGRPIAVRLGAAEEQAAGVARDCLARLASLLELAGARVELDLEHPGAAARERYDAADVTISFAADGTLGVGIAGRLAPEALTELRSTLSARLGGGQIAAPEGGAGTAEGAVLDDGEETRGGTIESAVVAAGAGVAVRLRSEPEEGVDALCQRVAVAVFDALAAAAEASGSPAA